MCPSCKKTGGMRLNKRCYGSSMNVVTDDGLYTGLHLPQYCCQHCNVGLLPMRACTLYAAGEIVGAGFEHIPYETLDSLFRNTHQDYATARHYLLVAGGYFPSTPSRPRAAYAVKVLDRRTVQEEVAMGSSDTAYVAALNAASRSRGVKDVIRVSQFTEAHGAHKSVKFVQANAVANFGTVHGPGLCPCCTKVVADVQVDANKKLYRCGTAGLRVPVAQRCSGKTNSTMIPLRQIFQGSAHAHRGRPQCKTAST